MEVTYVSMSYGTLDGRGFVGGRGRYMYMYD